MANKEHIKAPFNSYQNLLNGAFNLLKRLFQLLYRIIDKFSSSHIACFLSFSFNKF